MLSNNQFDIEDKIILTKTANTLSIFADQQIFTNIVNINANLYNLVLPPSGTLPPPSGSDPVFTKTNVFFDNFNVPVDNLPGTGSLEEKVITYVCQTWDLTLK
jgi:hypothetical protein